MQVRHIEYGLDGEVIADGFIEVPDPEPTVAGEVAELRATVAELLAIIEGT